MLWSRGDRVVFFVFACMAGALSMVGAMACGESPGSSTQRSSAVSPTSVVRVGTSNSRPSALDTDGDNERPGSSLYDPDNDAVSTYGQLASVVDSQKIATVIRRYYVAGAMGDGARACSLSYGPFVEALVENHQGEGPRSLRGKSCAQLESMLFKQRHRELSEDVAKFRVAWVRVKHNEGLALLRFGELREREVIVHRVGDDWKMNVLLDEGAP